MRGSLPLLFAVLLGALAVLAAPPARAGEDGSAPREDAVARLTAEERAFVEQRVPGWAELEPRQQQRIAHNIIRMRTMTESERKRLGEHIQRMKSRDRSRGRYRDHATRALIGKALAREARRTLGRDFERSLRRRDVSEQAFEVSFSMVFWRTVSKQQASAGDPPAPDALPESFPARWRERYAQAYARFAELGSDATDAPEATAKERAGMARRLHFTLAMARGEAFRARVRTMDKQGDAQLDAIAEAIRAEWPQALAQSLADPEALVEAGDRFELRRAVKRLVTRTERLEKEEAAVLASLLARLAVHHRKDATGADAVLVQVLVRELGVPAEEAAKLPAAGEPEARAAFLARVLRRASGHGFAGRHDGGSQRDGGRSPRRRGGPPTMERPEGVSDADWAVWTKARDAAMAARDMDALRALWTTPPEGMSEAGHRLVVEALKARMGPGRGNRAPR